MRSSVLPSYAFDPRRKLEAGVEGDPKRLRAVARARRNMGDGRQDRVRAWDAELDLRRREEFATATVDASREQAKTAASIRLGIDAFARSFLDDLAT